MHPGPRLNLIMGPNGAGKSAIVCGVILALGGKVEARARSLGRSRVTAHAAPAARARRRAQVLKRASKVTTLIRNGAHEAVVQARARGGAPPLPAVCVTVPGRRRRWGGGGGR